MRKTSLIVLVLLILTASLGWGAVSKVFRANVFEPETFGIAPPMTLGLPLCSGGLSLCGFLTAVSTSFVGLTSGTSASAVIKTSATGSVWSPMPSSAPGFVTGPIFYLSGRTIVRSATLNCTFFYTDNGGVSFSTATVIVPDSGFCNPGYVCSGTTCLVAGSSAPPPTFAPRFTVMRSTDRGATWSAAFVDSGSLTGLTSNPVFYFDGTSAIISISGGSVPAALFVSSTGGSAWARVTLGTAEFYDGAAKINNTFYLVRTTGTLRSSTTLTSWSALYTPTLSPTPPGTPVRRTIVGFNEFSPPTLYWLIGNVSDFTTRVYTSIDGVSFTALSGVASNGGLNLGSIVKDGNTLYFGHGNTGASAFFPITQ